jgi:hypothetical protein
VIDRQELEEALVALVKAGGNSEKAVRDGDVHADPRMLRKWRQENPELYRRLEQQHFSGVEEATRSQAQQTAHAASDLEADLLARVREKLPGMDGKDAANAARAVADVKKKAVDTWTALTDRNPDGNQPDEDPWEIIRKGVAAGVFKLTLSESLMPPEPDEDSPAAGGEE